MVDEGVEPAPCQKASNNQDVDEPNILWRVPCRSKVVFEAVFGPVREEDRYDGEVPSLLLFAGDDAGGCENQVADQTHSISITHSITQVVTEDQVKNSLRLWTDVCCYAELTPKTPGISGAFGVRWELRVEGRNRGSCGCREKKKDRWKG